MKVRTFTRLLLLATVTLSAALLSHAPGGAHRHAAASGPARQPAANALGGAWTGQALTDPAALLATKEVPVHASVLPDGRLFYWSRQKTQDAANPANDGLDVTGFSDTFLVDPLYLDHPGYTKTVANTTTNLFCSGHTFLPDGRLLVTGGHRRALSPPDAQLPPGSEFAEGLGEDAVNTFDYRTDSWVRQTTGMERGRWYPFNVTLGTGETLIMSGTFWSNEGSGAFPQNSLNRDIEIRDLQGGLRKLTTDGTTPQIRWYPYLSLTPQGKVFIAKPGSSSTFNEVSRMIDPYAPHPAGGFGVYTEVSRPAETHYEGSSVMYAPGKVLMLGGSTLSLGGAQSKNAEYIDFAEAFPQWRAAGSMTWARQYTTATVLPDGKVLVTGGTSCPGVNNLSCAGGGAVHTPELWDPASKTFQQMTASPHQVPRVYHSTAMLLPDGRVLVGGGGLPAANGETAPRPGGSTLCQGAGGGNDPVECRKFGHRDAEIFAPPYLFDASGAPAVRPSITSAPAHVAYGKPFSVGVGNVDASDIKEVVLIRLPSVTHTFNQDQRRVVLGAPTVTSPDSITVGGPADGNVCPPGPYMMFVVRNNGRGTPSAAKIVRVGHLSLERTGQVYPINGSANNTLGVSASGATAWTASSDATWVTITGGASGAGSGTITFNVSSNAAGTAPRRARITVSPVGHEAASVKYEFNVFQAAYFNDVTYDLPDPAFANAISAIYARGLTTGREPGKFYPQAPVSRAEMATFLTRALRGSNTPPEPLTQRFFDVGIGPSGHWARAFIEYIAREGVTTGYGDGNFGPEDLTTREQMAVFLCRALGVKEPPRPSADPFNDVPRDNLYAPFIAEIKRRGITLGCGNNDYCPQQSVSREQMALFLVRAFNL
jgi:hypothetical protein